MRKPRRQSHPPGPSHHAQQTGGVCAVSDSTRSQFLPVREVHGFHLGS